MGEKAGSEEGRKEARKEGEKEVWWFGECGGVGCEARFFRVVTTTWPTL